MKEIKNPTTEQARDLLGYRFSKIELCKELGITRPTLDARLSGKSEWKVLEVKWISALYNYELEEYRLDSIKAG